MSNQSNDDDITTGLSDVMLLDTQALLMLKDIMQHEFNELLTLYRTDARQLLTTLISAFNKNELLLLIRTNHTLKSSSQHIGARRVSEITVRIENMLYAKKYSNIAPILPLLEDTLEQTLLAIEKTFPDTGT